MLREKKEIDLKQLRQLCVEGDLNQKDLATYFNVSVSFINKLIHENNLPYRRKRVEAIDVEELRRMVSENQLNQKQIAKHFGVTESVISHTIGYHKIPYQKKLGKYYKNEILSLIIKKGLSESELAEHFETTPSAIQRMQHSLIKELVEEIEKLRNENAVLKDLLGEKQNQLEK